MLQLQQFNNHWHEWVVDSAVDPTLTDLNVRSLVGTTPYDYLLYALPQTERRNDGRLREKYLRQYAHTELGGWWVSGLDPLNNWEPMLWGRFKPDNPRVDWEKGKPIKYESPPKTPNRVTYFNVPNCIWDLVARRYNIKRYHSPLVLRLQDRFKPPCFWEWVQQHPEIPIILTEGEKKAACLLSLGFVAIALPGIWNGCVGKKDFDERLHPDLMPLAQMGRKFIILYDYETNPKTRWSVYQATVRTGKQIFAVGCQCEVASLPGPEKGIDDWAIALGKKTELAVRTLIDDALTLSEYQQSFFVQRNRGLFKYKPDIKVNSRYLSNAVKRLPEAGLVCLLSDMGTGKTELLARWRQENPDQSFLNNGHRVNLLKNLASRLVSAMYSAVNGGNLGQVSALSITIDSLYKMANNLQAYGCVFIDEACQYLAHLLKSKTCRSHRASILEVLECVVYRAKLVVLADAHLDDLTIDFFRAMRPSGEQPFIIQNDWKSGGREVHWYEGTNSSALTAQIHASVLTGQKAIVVSDSKRYIKKLERSFLMLNDSLLGDAESENSPEPEADRQLRVWAIHSENSGSEENVTFIQEINTAVKNIDVLLTSPSLGTGVDICDYHFDVIFGAFHAVSQSATECAQQLWRYRPNVPMHVWVSRRPPFGYALTNPKLIKQRYLQRNEMTAFLIRIDRESGRRGAEKDWALDTSCLIEAQRNWSINNLRADLRFILEEMGNTIIPMGDSIDESAKNLMKAAGAAIDWEHCEAVAKSKDIDHHTYSARQRQDYLKPSEILECEKFRISDTYGMAVTPQLVEIDDGGRLIRKLVDLEAILSAPGETITDDQGRRVPTPPQLVAERDKSERERLTICTDWGNNSTTWLIRHQLGLREILTAMMQDGQQFTGNEQLIQNLTERSQQYRPHIKQILGITIPPDAKPMWILGTYLGQLGLETRSRRVGVRGEQVRHYTLTEDALAFAQQVLKYRHLKRESKERQRQLDQETAAKRTTGMHTQYGIQPHSPPVVTPPPFIGGEYFKGRGDYQTEQVEILNDDWWSKVKCCARSLIEGWKYGGNTVKQMLSTLTMDERWGVMFEWEDSDPDQFNQFAALVPDWAEWCG